jgi:two-component system NtrC family sensor kinase
MIRFKFPLRAKLIVSLAVVIILGVFLSTIIGIRLIGTTIIRQAQDKVRLDLNSAREVYNEESESIKTIIRLTANRFFIKDAIENRDFDPLLVEMQKIRTAEGLDVLTLTDAEGRILLRARNPGVKGDKPADEVIRWALRTQDAVVAAEIISQTELEKDGTDIAARAEIDLVATPKAAYSGRERESRGMMLKAAAPVFDYDGNLSGILYGGMLLNRNYEIVDKVKDIVYKGELYKGTDIGTATIFLDGARISTNVMTADGSRAIGTRVSQEVYDQVIGRGVSWLGRAFVVNDWYMTAYEPIKSIEGNIIGMLYVGMLEAPYVDLRNRVIYTFLGIAAISVLLLSIIAYFTTSFISKPIKELLLATKKIAAGDLSHRVNIESQDEIGDLAESFNQMTIALQFANENYLFCTRTLEKKVEEKSQELEKTQDQLVQSEKLMALGKLAAGIAHEINNPLTSILLNSHIVAEKIGDDKSTKENLQLIIDETTRCGSIVKGLLEFARQTPPEMNLSDINNVIDRTLRLFESQMILNNIRVSKTLAPELPELLIDVNKMKQVFTNVILNGLEAMPDGGELLISTRVSDDSNQVEAVFRDTGYGISKEDVKRIFDPFFTTKGTKGTGLGLAVSYGIIQQHRGEIEIESEKGKGTTVIIRLPVNKGQKTTKEDINE